MPSSSRRAYIDWARGLAVLLMIEAHVFDAWTRAADRQTIAFRNATLLGGLAAPLFLFLAGVSIALAAPRAARRAGDSRWTGARTVCARGLEIFILAFLFRLQAFIVSPGNPIISIFRVDILNIMGPAIAAAALVWAISNSRIVLAIVYSGIAAAVAMITPAVRASGFVDLLPVWLQWYVRPAGEHTTFTLFPWAGFVFAGAAVGVLIASRPVATPRGNEPMRSASSNERHRRSESQMIATIGASGLVLVLAGFWAATRPQMFPGSSFWTTSPTYFAIRVGLMASVLSMLFAVETMLHKTGRPAVTDPLAALGQHSLFVYWIHVELVYGYASWLWKNSLPVWGTTAGLPIFCALMYGAVVIRNRVAMRAGARPAATPASAAA